MCIRDRGSGVGRTDDGIAVFVQGSAIGDELKVRILKVKDVYKRQLQTHILHSRLTTIHTAIRHRIHTAHSRVHRMQINSIPHQRLRK